ncbi:MAG TPA: minor capsid protein [Jatrophihabitans sp.]|nr:minor capsid protein [Jatrophihabitans sp.]
MSLSAFETGLAELLAAAGIGTWRPDTPYASDETAILIRSIPNAPDRLIVITAWLMSNDPGTGDALLCAQIRTRASTDPTTDQDVDDQVFNALNGLHDTSIGGVPVTVMWHQSSLPLGPDANQRWENSNNFYARVAWPSQLSTD